ncbi:MAG: hypothetical protein WBL44_08450, partial [Nitrososphaeraceae archaeon]
DNTTQVQVNPEQVEPGHGDNPEQNVIANKIEEQKQQAEKTPIGTPAKQSQSAPESPNVNPPGSEEQREEADTDEAPCAKAAAELEAKIAEYDSKIKSFEEFRENYLKEQKQSKVQAKRNKIENVIPKEYADSEEERNKAIASLE